MKDQVQVTTGLPKEAESREQSCFRTRVVSSQDATSTSQPDPMQGIDLVSSFKKTLTIRPTELGQKTESVLGSQVSSHPVGKRCCWGNLNGLCSCLSQGREAGPGRGFLPGEARDLKGPSGHSAKTSWNARAGDRDALPATSKSHGPPGCETCNIRG